MRFISGLSPSVAVAGMIAPPNPAISAAAWVLSLGLAPSVNAQMWVFRAWVCLRFSLRLHFLTCGLFFVFPL